MMEPLPNLSDAEVIRYYRAWSEECWAAAFMALPLDGTLPLEFLDWLDALRAKQTWTSYEQELLQRWRMTEKGDATITVKGKP